ncbi:cytochrome P450 [Calidithermus roseus]|uniref:Polyketide biosynthesis cytochrome P450 PksS n=1 Tax=Calidithermus roseus TaxID=1644118 RepID=A0A399EXL1_9DEIN|nr:cytochrome P450 [Calidithermus roseus]RIH89304.1 Polyketide biosynthesis cytochrome P450 PksS [Calidithermus roseus]
MTPSFNPTDPAFLANPYPTYRRLREESPIFFFEKWHAYVLTRYDDVNTLLRDRRLGRVLENYPQWGEYEWQFEQTRVGSILEIEPPDHTRIKEVFHQTFTPKRVRELSGKVHALCERLVDDLLKRPQRQADLIHDFAQPIPVTVIADLLGIPEADRHHLVPWSKGIIGWFEPERTKAMEAEAIRCAQEFAAYLRAMIPLKRQQPGDDLFSAMLQVHDREPERLSEQELINNCILLLNAGHEAVVNVMGNGMKALLSHPEQYARLKADPSLIPTAVEEMMRYDTPLQFFERYVLEPLEYKGQRWERGTKLVLYYASANHDPAVFRDPETFDITRNPNPHLAFGAGLHYCIGAPLARVELQTALRVLLERLPELRLLPQEFRYMPKNVFRYLEGLKVAY